jgi:hypothetical protein
VDRTLSSLFLLRSVCNIRHEIQLADFAAAVGYIFAYFFRFQKVVIIIVLEIQERDNLTFKSPLLLAIIVESLLYFRNTLHAKGGRYGHKLPF